jgi:eukaryotic-like serine/threonine-protein kinase
MSCPDCGAENRVRAKFCKDCGAKLAVATPSEATQPVSSPPGGGQARDATTEVNARFATAVPLKDLASQPTAHEPETTPFATLTGRLATTERRLLGVLALAVIAIIVGIIAATSGGNSTNSTSAPVANTDNQTSATTPSTTPPTTTPPPAATTPTGAPSNLPSGHWVVFLGSFSNPDNATNARGSLTSSVPDASILHSDDYTSLLPGFWVVYVDRSFIDPQATLSFCHSLGLNTDHECHGRYLSSAPGLDGHDPRFTASNGQ